ncbi:DEBR0S2_19372g1_1 [Brettanomyces bruxellensis]|uniref:DEBR0S2_19372g1_1 n=1 Tax=Dekkera bruxellensis TaxID=5007 RepID=A0A7D9GZE0_DEKBR|nr:DEBR0S2_19372g1_1 [Brettanomyces bruxellensis]
MMSEQNSVHNIIKLTDELFDSSDSPVTDSENEHEDANEKLSPVRKVGDRTFDIDDSDVKEMNENVIRELFIRKIKNGLEADEHTLPMDENSSEESDDPDYVPGESDEDDDYSDDNEKDFEYIDSDGSHNMTFEAYHPDKNRMDSDPRTESEEIEDQLSIEPPASAKRAFLLYLLKCMPLILVVISLFLISNISSLLPSATVSNEGSGFVHHKLYMLDKQLQGLQERQLSMESTLNKRYAQIEKQIRQAASASNSPLVLSSETIPTADIASLRSNISSMNSRLDTLKTMITDTKRLASLQKDTNIEQQLDKLASEIKAEVLRTLKAAKVAESNIPKKVQVKPFKKQHFQTYFEADVPTNVIPTARIVARLTTLPRVQRLRTNAVDRILHGFSDFARRKIRRTDQQKSLTGIQDINLIGEQNSPNNALTEDPNKFWQALSSSMPIMFTMSLRDPIYLFEVGISHPRYKYLIHSAPRLVELLVGPEIVDGAHVGALRKKASQCYNQDFLSSTLRKQFVKVGEMEYDVRKSDQYQKIDIPKQLKQELSQWKIREVMLVVSSNWGDENITALDTVRVFGTNRQAPERGGGSEEIPNLGEDTPVL